MRFALATPSRGLIHSRTVAAVIENVAAARAAGHEYLGWAISHDLPIPDCHTRVATEALGTAADCVWFVEEDSVPPPATLVHLIQLLAADKSVGLAFCDYAVRDYNCAAHKHGAPETGAPTEGAANPIVWCGLGCTLVRRQVFEDISAHGLPWFDTRESWQVVPFGQTITKLRRTGHPYEYGGEDIWFAITATEECGHRIERIPPTEMVCGHASVTKMGKPLDNQGCHQVLVAGYQQIKVWI